MLTTPGNATEATEPVKVMVVDDHSMFVEGLARVLKDVPDVKVVGTAATVDDAVSLAVRHHPDVVLMDYELPDGDGVEAAIRIRADRPETKIVMLTAFGEDAVLLAAPVRS
jgi:DNA-binding NarL/FixJ family response regulator